MVMLRASCGVVVIALAACSVGEVPSGGVPVDAPPVATDTPSGTPDAAPDAGVDPSVSYDMIIKPLVSSLGCLGCHPAQHAPDLSAYDKVDAIYLKHPGTGSQLVTHGPHQGNPFFNDDQKKIVSDWIDSVPAK